MEGPWGIAVPIKIVSCVVEKVDNVVETIWIELGAVSNSEYCLVKILANTYINNVEVFILICLGSVILSAVNAAEDETIGKQAQQDGLWKIHQRVAVHLKALPAQVKMDGSEKLGVDHISGRIR